ncbi:aminotransferase class I/II-fold pyridoxal phosphate-dependent enzyme, partial [Salmonella enterica subsp. enterica serovar Kentucky]|nr:aminotransferase class I/II-fold pyridoxal phosphate-dependent enzyme [Salmonella enterica subsp. enterica serovar Kentucky]
DESSDWFPDLDDIRAKITPRTRGIVIINPNNPTGAVYSKELFARSASVGAQQFPVHWGGDCYANYESMAESLRGGLSIGLSG